MDRSITRNLPALVSVVVPIGDFDEFARIQLKALAEQDYRGQWEIIIVNNDPESDSQDRISACVQELPGLAVRTQVVRSFSATNAAIARNVGIDVAKGDFMAFCDADDRVALCWLRELVAGGQHADLAGGWLNTEPLNPIAQRRWRSSYPRHRLPSKFGFLPYSQAANLGVWNHVFQAVGTFDPSLNAGEDIDFCWRAQIAGFSLGFASEAEVWYRHRRSIWELARQSFRYGIGDVVIRRRYSEYLEMNHSFSDIGRSAGWLIVRAPYLVLSSRRRGIWVRECANTLGKALEYFRT